MVFDEEMDGCSSLNKLLITFTELNSTCINTIVSAAVIRISRVVEKKIQTGNLVSRKTRLQNIAFCVVRSKTSFLITNVMRLNFYRKREYFEHFGCGN